MSLNERSIRVTHLSAYESLFDDSKTYPPPISCRVLGSKWAGKFTFIQSVFQLDVLDSKKVYKLVKESVKTKVGSDEIFDTLERLFDAQRQAISSCAKPASESKPIKFSSVLFGYMDQPLRLMFGYKDQPFVLLPSSCVENDKQYKQNVIILFVNGSRDYWGEQYRLYADTLSELRYHVEKNDVTSIIVAVNKIDKTSDKYSEKFQSEKWFNTVVEGITQQLAEICKGASLGQPQARDEICEGIESLRLSTKTEPKHSDKTDPSSKTDSERRVIDIKFVPTSATTGRNTIHGTTREICDWYQGDTVMQILANTA